MEMRDIMDLWEANVKKERESKIKDLINTNLILFFDKDGEYFGCPEESRMVFAKLKQPDEDIKFADEAAFLAYNLSKAFEEEDIPKRLFYKKDIPELKLIDKDDLDKKLFGI